MQSERERYIFNYLLGQEQHFLLEKSCQVWVGTWNVNGNDPSSDLSRWLFEWKQNASGDFPDILLISLQEIERRPEAVLIGSRKKEFLWNACILESLEQIFADKKYRLARSEVLVGVYAGLFAESSWFEQIKSVSTATMACGVLNYFGNKGAVAIKAKVGGSYLCFISCHLTPHSQNLNKRLQEIEMIMEKIRFPTPNSVGNTERYLAFWNVSPDVWDCDVLFVCGDLNFRIDLPLKKILELASIGNPTLLLEKDQLCNAMENGKNVLSLFDEEEIGFVPTYKFLPGTKSYLPEELNKAPAYTDRILFRVGDPLHSLFYESMNYAYRSDHVPVSGIFVSQIRTIDFHKSTELLKSCLFLLDLIENRALAKTMITRDKLCLEYRETKHQVTSSFTLLNSGECPIAFSITLELEDGNQHKILTMYPPSGFLASGQSETIEISGRCTSKEHINGPLIKVLINGSLPYFIQTYTV